MHIGNFDNPQCRESELGHQKEKMKTREIFALFLPFQLDIFVVFTLVTLMNTIPAICDDIVGSEVILLQVVFRHGDRSAINSFPNDKYTENSWPEGYGQLTKRGMEQHYQLGSYFRKRYIEGNPYSLLEAAYNRSEIHARSTDYDRTLMSAYCNLAGMFPPANGTEWHAGIEWQPIPVHTVPRLTDQLLNMNFPCPKAIQLYKEMLKSDRIKKEEAENKEFYQFVSNKTGAANESIQDIWKVYDTIFCELQHPELGFVPYAWLNETFGNQTVLEKLRALEALQFDVQFDTAEESRLRGGTLVGELVKNMQSKVQGTLDPPASKMFMYSAHDTTLVALASALKVFNKKSPPYASAILVELHQSQAPDGAYHVRVLYHNTSVADASAQEYPLTLPGCEEFCPLDKFVDLTAAAIPKDLDSECQVSSDNNELLIAIVISAAGVLLIIIVVAVVVCRKKRNVPYYRYTGLEDEA